jgi:molybdenum cofactor guanylyltransferase
MPRMAGEPAHEHITGLVLAGGRGSRMGGVDKGLQLHHGVPLAQHALRRLQPQVGALMVNANRNLERYAAFGAPVWPDTLPDFAGPLAGLLVGMTHCTTPYLVTVPCDTPNFPADLVQRLAAALAGDDAEIAMAVAPEPGEDGPRWRTQPVFCLAKTSLRDSLVAFLQSGQRKVDRWTAQHRVAEVRFGDAAAFFNANTLEELRQLDTDSRSI